MLIHPGSPASVVLQVMGDLFEWLQTSHDHPLVKGSVFHYEFEFIHLFMDGNGRVGRLWHSLILRKWRPIFAWMPVETLIHRHQQEYYDALLEAGRAGDSTVFVEFILGIIRDALVDVKDQQTNRAIANEQPMATDVQPMDDRWATDRVSIISQYLDEHGRASVADIARLLGLSKDRSRAIVRSLVSESVLVKHGNGRYTYYTLNE